MGLWISAWAAWKRNLRFLWVEVPGFAGLCLLTPVLYLAQPAGNIRKALLLYGLFGGYFILSLFYVKVRQKLAAHSTTKPNLAPEDRSWEGRGALLSHVAFVVLALIAAGPAHGLTLGPLYALIRVWMGLKWGRPNLPLMKLGVREMIHSLVFAGLILGFWKMF